VVLWVIIGHSPTSIKRLKSLLVANYIMEKQYHTLLKELFGILYKHVLEYPFHENYFVLRTWFEKKFGKNTDKVVQELYDMGLISYFVHGDPYFNWEKLCKYIGMEEAIKEKEKRAQEVIRKIHKFTENLKNKLLSRTRYEGVKVEKLIEDEDDVLSYLQRKALERELQPKELAREPRVYWVQGTRSEQDKLIFDAGYEGGDLYIYELRGVVNSEDARKEVKRHYNHVADKDLTYYFIKIKFKKEPTWWRIQFP